MNRNKTVRLFIAVVAIFLLTIIVVPILFKGKIIKLVRQSANTSLEAKLDFKEIDVSLFRSFPQLDIRIKQLSITGINEFEGKPLLNIETLSTSVSLSSLWNSDAMTISEIVLNRPEVNFLIAPDGKANWDITKPTAAGKAEGNKKTMKIELTKIELINAGLSFYNDPSKMFACFKNGNFELSGLLKGSDSRLNFKGKADSIDFEYDGRKMVQGMNLDGDGSVQANFDQMSFRFLDNRILVNKLPLAFQGTFGLGEKSDLLDLTLRSDGASLEELTSFLPREQQQKIKAFEKSGHLSFEGSIKGTYSDTTYPALKADLKLSGGSMKYPSRQLAINGINLEASLNKPQGILDSLKISIGKMEANLGGHPLLANLSVSTPVSNPLLSGERVGELDFTALKQALPVDSMEIGGLARANIKFNGPSSAIEKGTYDRFQTKGDITLQDFFYRSPLFPDRLGIQSAKYTFDAKEISIASMKGKLGLSDFTVDGKFANYWAYILKNGTILGNLKIKSDLLDVTQLMNGGTRSKDSTVHNDPVKIPSGIDLTIQVEVNRMLYNRMEINGTTGKLIIRDQKLNLDQLAMNLLKGKMVLSGIYSCQEKSPAEFNFKMDIKDFDLPTAYQSVGLVRHILPFAGKSKGTFFSVMSLSGKLEKDYAPVFAALNGSGQIALKNTELVGNGMFTEIGKYFRKDLFTNVKVNDFTGNITISNGALAISPFTTRIANQEVTVSGSQSLSLDLNYQLNFKVNKSDLSSDVSGWIGLVPGTENIDKYPIRIDLVGNISKPEIKVDLSEAKTLVANEFKKKAKSSLQDVAKKLGLENLFK